MDGTRIIEDLLNGGFKPETKKEQALIDTLEDGGFVYKSKETGDFFMREGVKKTENYDEIILTMEPVVKTVGLYSVNNNLSPTLDIKIKNPNVFLGLVNNAGSIKKIIGNKKIGDKIDATIVGYACDGKNEGFKVEFDAETMEEVNLKYKTMVMATAFGRGAKAKDTKNLDFKGVRPTKVKLVIGVDTNFGVCFSESEMEKLGRNLVLDKASFYN